MLLIETHLCVILNTYTITRCGQWSTDKGVVWRKACLIDCDFINTMIKEVVIELFSSIGHGILDF